MVYGVQEEDQIMQKSETGYTYSVSFFFLRDSTLNLLKWKRKFIKLLSVDDMLW